MVCYVFVLIRKGFGDLRRKFLNAAEVSLKAVVHCYYYGECRGKRVMNCLTRPRIALVALREGVGDLGRNWLEKTSRSRHIETALY